MTKLKILFLLSFFCITSMHSSAQKITRFLNIPAYSSGTFTKFNLKNKGVSGKQLKLNYDTVPLRNTMRLINRNFKEIYVKEQIGTSSLELDISKATILQENLLREAEQSLLASDTQIASAPVSIFR